MCSLSYPACKAHALYYTVICSLSGSTVFFLITNGTIFGEEKYWTQNVFWFSLQLLSETFLILRRIQRDTATKVRRTSRKVPVILVRLQSNFNFLDLFKKILKHPLSWKSFRLEPSWTMQTGRHDEAKCRFSQFCERAKNGNQTSNEVIAVSYFPSYEGNWAEKGSTNRIKKYIFVYSNSYKLVTVCHACSNQRILSKIMHDQYF